MKILVTLVIIALAILSGVLGYNLALLKVDQGYYSPTPEVMTIEESIEFLEYARYSHSYLAEHPEKCIGVAGKVEDNIRWTKNYDGIIKLIRDMECR